MTAMQRLHEERQRGCVLCLTRRSHSPIAARLRLEERSSELEKELATHSVLEVAGGNPDWRIEREVLLAENSLLSETVDELRRQLASRAASLSTEWDRERRALMTQVKDLSSQLVARTSDAQPSPLPDEDDSGELAEEDVEELRKTLSQVRRANSRLLRELQALKGNIQAGASLG